jgi:hypothetical protein
VKYLEKKAQRQYFFAGRHISSLVRKATEDWLPDLGW